MYKHSGGQLTATFRWEAPERANGVIRGYEAQCWMLPVAGSTPGAKASACADARLSPLHTQLMLRNLVPSSQYYFQVRTLFPIKIKELDEYKSLFYR